MYIERLRSLTNLAIWTCTK